MPRSSTVRPVLAVDIGGTKLATGRPVFVDNDAKAVALAEGWVGAAVGVGAFLGMVVSTGIGGGIVLDGRLLDGQAGNAGHIGHVVVEPGGRRCFCGGQGCLEGESSGRAIEAITGRPPAVAPPPVVERTGRLVRCGRALQPRPTPLLPVRAVLPTVAVSAPATHVARRRIPLRAPDSAYHLARLSQEGRGCSEL